MKYFYILLFAVLMLSASFAQPVINGIMDDPQYTTLATNDGASESWGDFNKLGSIKYYSDGTKLYIGICGVIQPNWNKILLLINFSEYNGVSPNTKLPSGAGINGYFSNLAGTDPDIETDFALSFTTDASSPLYTDGIRYGTNNVVSGGNGIGSSPKDGTASTFNSATVINILGGSTGGFIQAYKPDFDRTSNSNHGIELAIDISAFPGVTANSTVNFFVAITGANGDWFSKIFLPDFYTYVGGGTGLFAGDFGGDPDLEWQAWNARDKGFSNVHFYTTPNSPLPVELNSFTAYATVQEVQLNWTTATELNNSGFEIQRSNDKSNWEKIAFVNGNGSSNSPKYYSYSDNSFARGLKVFYRLKQIDNDGKSELSKVVEVITGAMPNGFTLEQNYPNPFNPSTTINFGFQVQTKAVVKVYDALGNEAAELFNGLADAGRVYELHFDASNFPSGVYYCKLTGNDKMSVKKMILIK